MGIFSPRFFDRRIFTLLCWGGAVFALFFFFSLGTQDAHASPKTKTVEYFFFQYSSATNISANNGIKNTTWPSTCDSVNNASTSIAIPESGTVTIRSAWIEWRSILEGATTGSGDMRFCRQGQSPSSISLGSINTDSAESQPIILRMDVTSQIIVGTNTYWFNARVDNTIRNMDSVKIYITYEYDPSSATQLKTNKYFIGCRASQAPSNTIDAFMVNPNISETSVTVESNWIEYNGQTPGSSSTDLGVSASLNAATSSVVTLDNVNRSAMDFLLLANIPSATVNLTANNDINLVNASNTANLKCAEWVITYSYSHYGAAILHSATSRYFLGQTSGFLAANSTTTIGSNAVNLPENSLTFRSVWARYVFGNSSDETVDIEVSIGGTATTTSFGYKVDVEGASRDSTGKAYIFFDITSFFTTNWTNGATITARMFTSAASVIEAVSAELIITYSFNAQNTDTALKSIVWFVGQDTAKNSGGTAFTGSFSPIISEATTTITRRNSVTLVDFIMGSSGTVETTTIDDTVASGTDTQSITIEANVESTTYQTILKTTTQWTNATNTSQTINFTYNVTGANHNDGGIGYITYEYIFNATPTVSGVSLNGGLPIDLIENTTTSILVTGLLTDTDGGANISNATATIYRSGVGALCVADDNNCYTLATTDCVLSVASGNNKNATCTVGIWFLADSTDGVAPIFSAQIWSAELTAIDAFSVKGSATNTAESIEINTLLALDVTPSFAYGSFAPEATSTDAQQQTLVVTTTGNVAIDITLQATEDMCTDADYNNALDICPVATDIDSTQSEYSTSTNFEYRDEAGDDTALGIFRLASTSAKSLELQSTKPTTHNNKNSDTFDDTFWKIGIPSGQDLGDYNGTTTILATQD